MSEILQWLKGPRDYDEGVRLYQSHGFNMMLKQTFIRHGRTRLTEQTLLEEMRKLANLTQEQLTSLGRQPRKKKKASSEAKAAIDKAQRFRKQFPFLSESSCPDVLKVAVSDMFTAFGKYKEAHAALQEVPDDDMERAAALSKETVENYLTDRALWRELEYYRDHGELLGEAPLVRRAIEARSYADLDDIALMGKYNSGKTRLSKARSARKSIDAHDTERLQRNARLISQWTMRLELMREEIERRKKK